MYVTFSKRGGLDKNSVLAKFAYTATDGKKYNVDCYNLDVIISVGYHVKFPHGTQFRIWAMEILKEYMKKGYSSFFPLRGYASFSIHTRSPFLI